MMMTGESQSTWRKIIPSVALSTINPITSLDLSSEKEATDRLTTAQPWEV